MRKGFRKFDVWALREEEYSKNISKQPRREKLFASMELEVKYNSECFWGH